MFADQSILRCITGNAVGSVSFFFFPFYCLRDGLCVEKWYFNVSLLSWRLSAASWELLSAFCQATNSAKARSQVFKLMTSCSRNPHDVIEFGRIEEKVNKNSETLNVM